MIKCNLPLRSSSLTPNRKHPITHLTLPDKVSTDFFRWGPLMKHYIYSCIRSSSISFSTFSTRYTEFSLIHKLFRIMPCNTSGWHVYIIRCIHSCMLALNITLLTSSDDVSLSTWYTVFTHSHVLVVLSLRHDPDVFTLNNIHTDPRMMHSAPPDDVFGATRSGNWSQTPLL